MSETAIKVQNLSKIYKLYNDPKERFKEAFHPLRKKYHYDFYALHDLSFEIKKGETVGIIGQNGSGKSTLLKIITGVLTPSTGVVETHGKISSLLELGAGFNPELTGLENVYFNGSILGFSKEEMDEKLDDILSFADIGEFVNQPVKTYSSGMFVRLAFSVATQVDPEILIVDEALSVGDMFFQAKCITRMKKMIDNDGTTLLFVSHDMGSVKSICKDAVLLSNGNMIMKGSSADVGDFYMRQMYDSQIGVFSEMKLNKISISDNVQVLEPDSQFKCRVSTKEKVDLGNHTYEYGSKDATILDVKLLNRDYEIIEAVHLKEDFILQVSFLLYKDISNACVGYKIKDEKGIELYGSSSAVEKLNVTSLKKGYVLVFNFDIKNIINVGNYSISVGIEDIVEFNSKHISLVAIDNAVVFRVVGNGNLEDNFWTKVHLPVPISYQIVKKV